MLFFVFFFLISHSYVVLSTLIVRTYISNVFFFLIIEFYVRVSMYAFSFLDNLYLFTSIQTTLNRNIYVHARHLTRCVHHCSAFGGVPCT